MESAHHVVRGFSSDFSSNRLPDFVQRIKNLSSDHENREDLGNTENMFQNVANLVAVKFVRICFNLRSNIVLGVKDKAWRKTVPTNQSLTPPFKCNRQIAFSRSVVEVSVALLQHEIISKAMAQRGCGLKVISASEMCKRGDHKASKT
jgi:hypothetical protein